MWVATEREPEMKVVYCGNGIDTPEGLREAAEVTSVTSVIGTYGESAERHLQSLTDIAQKIGAQVVIVVCSERIADYKTSASFPTVCLTPAQTEVLAIGYWKSLIDVKLSQ